MPSALINGVRLSWQLTGQSGDPLVLVHGSWIDHHNWDGIVPALSGRFRVVAYDRRGHSESERPAGQGDVSEDVSDLAELIEHLGLRPAHILGNSFGAVIALRLAANQPSFVRSLLVHEPPLFGLLDARAREDLLHGSELPLRPVIDLLEQGQMEAGARLFYETVVRAGTWAERPPQVRQRWIFNAPTFLDEERDPDSRRVDLPVLSCFRGPTLLTLGDQSPPVFRFIIEMLAHALPDSQVRTIAGAGHGPHVTHPAEYVETVMSFLRTFDSART
jgi:pimeloyl-ACP methyl ester carboxylesterase